MKCNSNNQIQPSISCMGFVFYSSCSPSSSYPVGCRYSCIFDEQLWVSSTFGGSHLKKKNSEEILIERGTATFRNICNPFTGYCWWEVFWLQIWHCRNLQELIPTAEVVICGTAVLAVKYRKLQTHWHSAKSHYAQKKVLVPLRDKDCMMQYSANRCCSSTRVHVTLEWIRGGAQTIDYKQQSENRPVVKASWWP